jgi:alpha-D-xyloside xylohydrolase
MFGPALMPCPVYEYGARSREVYLPDGGWYDFYTGEYLTGGRTVKAEAPFERMPLYARQGSIIPFGPEIEWSDEKPAAEIRLYVYAGADADFTLYEDDGLTYGYEKGESATIPIHWDDASRTLTLGARSGSFPGMLESRSFVVVTVDPFHPHPYDPDATGEVIGYRGDSVSLKL